MKLLLAILIVLLGAFRSALAVEADVLIRGATVYDGTGAAGRVADIAICGERIVAIGELEPTGRERVIDAAGLIAAPGFIDLHTHSDRSITKAATRANLNYVLQGVTTIVTGNCGSGPVDVADYFRRIEEHGAGTNVIHLIPQGSLRRKVMGTADRPPTAEEMEQMKQLVRRGMQDGAWGMSTGLIYVPSSFASTDELVELLRVVAQYGGIYATHMRNESTRLLQAIEEALEIGRRAKVPVHISHLKVSGQHAWGQAADAIRLIEQARSSGQRVTADQYPYIASSTSLAAMVIPARYRSKEKLTAALQDPVEGPRLRKLIEQNLQQRGNGRRLMIASYAANRTWQGKNLAELAETEHMTVLDLVLKIQFNGGASMINFSMNEEEVRLFMQQPFVATASDGSARDPSSPTVPHPRNYGCFARKIGRYAIAGKTISVEHAIRSASGLPADILQLADRGYIKPGYYADLVLLAPATYRDRATFQRPHQYASGVRQLWIGGKLVVDEGKFTGTLAGRVLRHPGPHQR